MTQQSAMEYIARGQTPFFRLPVAPLSALPGGTRAVFLGVPYDGGTTYRPGARFAPFEVRRVSALVDGYHPAHRVAVFDRAPAVDGGNVVFPPFDAGAVREQISAAEAERIGIVNRVVAAGEFDAAVQDWAERLAAKSPLLMRLGKDAMYRQQDMGFADALEYLQAQLSLAFSTEDIQEGVKAFFEKREPNWTGR